MRTVPSVTDAASDAESGEIASDWTKAPSTGNRCRCRPVARSQSRTEPFSGPTIWFLASTWVSWLAVASVRPSGAKARPLSQSQSARIRRRYSVGPDVSRRSIHFS